VSVTRNGAEIMRKDLRPIAVPPYALNNMSLSDLDETYGVQHEVAMIDLQAQPLFRDSTTDEINVFLWKRLADDDKKLSNVVTLRVINDGIGEFKILNVLWDKVQYLLVRQASKIQCASAQSAENITSVSKLWYTVCTSEKDEKEINQKRFVRVGRKHYFHMITLNAEEYEVARRRRVKAPGLHVVDTTEYNRLRSVNGGKYLRAGFVRRIVPAYNQLVSGHV
jgi:hypothetical protein